MKVFFKLTPREDKRIWMSKQHSVPMFNWRRNLIFKERWFYVDAKNNFVLMLWYDAHINAYINLYINVEKIYISKSKINHFFDVKSKLKFNVKSRLILGLHWIKFLLTLWLWCSRIYKIYDNVENKMYFNVDTRSFYRR